MSQVNLNELLEFYATAGPERVGFVLDDGSVVEVENVATDSENSFDVVAEDLVTFGDRAIASFHTHPGSVSNLSVDDHVAFLAWPDLVHYVVGSDGVRSFIVQDNSRIVQQHGPS